MGPFCPARDVGVCRLATRNSRSTSGLLQTRINLNWLRLVDDVISTIDIHDAARNKLRAVERQKGRRRTGLAEPERGRGAGKKNGVSGWCVGGVWGGGGGGRPPQSAPWETPMTL